MSTPLEPHRHFHEELSHLKQRLMAASAEAEEAVGNAVDALLTRNRVKAQEVRPRPGEFIGVPTEDASRSAAHHGMGIQRVCTGADH